MEGVACEAVKMGAFGGYEAHVDGDTPAHAVLSWIHRICSNLKGWARGVYHGL